MEINPSRVWIIMAIGLKDLKIAADTVMRVLSLAGSESLRFILVLDGAAGTKIDNDATPLKQIAQDYSEQVELLYSGAENGLLNLLKSLEVGWNRCFEQASENDFVVKLDPDCIILSNSLFERAQERLRKQGPGMVGNITLNPRGEARSIRKHAIKTFVDALLPVGIRKIGKTKDGRWRYSLSMTRPHYRPAIWQARRFGWIPGESVLGAFRMMNIETLRLIRNQRSYQASIQGSFLGLNREEDLFFSIYTKAVGHNLVELEPAETLLNPKAWFDAFSLNGLDMGQVKLGKYDAIHPAKADPEKCAVRSIFPVQPRNVQN